MSPILVDCRPILAVAVVAASVFKHALVTRYVGSFLCAPGHIPHLYSDEAALARGVPSPIVRSSILGSHMSSLKLLWVFYGFFTSCTEKSRDIRAELLCSRRFMPDLQTTFHPAAVQHLL